VKESESVVVTSSEKDGVKDVVVVSESVTVTSLLHDSVADTVLRSSDTVEVTLLLSLYCSDSDTDSCSVIVTDMDSF